MPGLDTAVKNGRALSDALERLLKDNGYAVESESYKGLRPGAKPPEHGERKYGRHRVDLVASTPEGRKVAISVKYQGVRGTVEEKVPWEALSMKRLLADRRGEFAAAYIVGGGNGFREWMRRYFESDVFRKDMRLPKNLLIMDTDHFERLVRAKDL